jgi:hypothetical protein
MADLIDRGFLPLTREQPVGKIENGTGNGADINVCMNDPGRNQYGCGMFFARKMSGFVAKRGGSLPHIPEIDLERRRADECEQIRLIDVLVRTAGYARVRYRNV